MAIEFKDIIINHPEFELLKTEKKNGKLTHAYMFESNDTRLVENFSLLFATLLMCNEENPPCFECVDCKKLDLDAHSDVMVFPKGKSIVVEDVKMMIDNSILKPLEGDKKVFIFKDFSNATIQAQNKLLKTLETPPDNVYIILEVSNINSVLPTIVSRCKRIKLANLKQEDLKTIVSRINRLSDANTIVEMCGGSLTRAINFVENTNFNDCYNLAIFTLENLKSSQTMLSVSTKIMEKKDYLDNFFEILISLLRDILLIRCGRAEYVENKQLKNNLINLASEFNADCVDLIVKRIYETKKQMGFNCNPTICVDNLLLYILEVKHKCKQ